MRCHKLKHQKELLKQLPSQTQAKVLSNKVLNFDREGIIKFIQNEIRFKDIVIKVIDIMDFHGSQITELY